MPGVWSADQIIGALLSDTERAANRARSDGWSEHLKQRADAALEVRADEVYVETVKAMHRCLRQCWRTGHTYSVLDGPKRRWWQFWRSPRECMACGAPENFVQTS